MIIYYTKEIIYKGHKKKEKRNERTNKKEKINR